MNKNSSEIDLRAKLVQNLKQEGILKSKAVQEALLNVKRENFVWPGEEASAYIDEPLSLGETGQTISAPHMVTIMLEEARLSPGMRILEIGTGSGYNAALIGYIVSKDCAQIVSHPVITIEREERLVNFARQNLKKSGLDNVVEVVWADGSLGYPQGSTHMIYDRIIVTAGAPRIPVILEQQLKADGILLVPVGPTPFQTLFKVRKVKSKAGHLEIQRENLMPVMFVPLLGKGV